MRTVEWDEQNKQLMMIDQRRLPGAYEVVSYATAGEVIGAIREMVIRGAPAIGVAGAYALVLAALRINTPGRSGFLTELYQSAAEIKQARPTAVNLSWAVDLVLREAQRCQGSPAEICTNMLNLANQMAEDDVQTNLRMAAYGADLITDGDTIIHHCNTGSLATVEWGTALGVIRMAHSQGKRVHVLVDETRPRLQGARLTAWELQQYGIPFEIITDNAAGYFLSRGQAQKVLFGADRVAANGDVANKIGTYMLSLAAWDNQVPVYAVFPSSTVDLNIHSGKDIPIEERGMDEVLNIRYEGQQVAPTGAGARNPAFDVTPNRLITALVTDRGVIYPPYNLNLPRVLANPAEKKDM